MPVGTQDELLRASGSTNNPWETVSATGNGAAFFVGAGRRIDFALAIASVTGTNPTLDVKLQASADGASSWTDLASFPQQTAAAVDASGTGSAYPLISVITPATKGYLRIVKTVGGTTPVFVMAVLHNPVDSTTP